jgi:hypothetical protein
MRRILFIFNEFYSVHRKSREESSKGILGAVSVPDIASHISALQSRRYKGLWQCMCNCRPPLWSSGQNSWLEILRSGFDSWRYQIFWEVAGLKRSSLCLVSTTEELLGRQSSGSGLENREYGHRDPSRWPRDNLHPQKLSLTSPTSGGCSTGIFRSRTKASELLCVSVLIQ